MAESLPATCWVVHDGAAGNRRQAAALADALHLVCTEHVVRARAPARWLAPRRLVGAGAAFGAPFAEALQAQVPAVVIGCGRIAALATRYARAQGAYAIQILDPRLPPRLWDLVIAPEHDQLQGNNVIPMLGSLNPVDAAWLQRARDADGRPGALPGPRTALLLGGPTAATPFDSHALATTLDTLAAWIAREGGSILACASRRTPDAWLRQVRERFAAPGHLVWSGPEDGANPYAAVLAWADRIVVTPDSANMLSEAAATTAPLYIAAADRASGRLARLVTALVGQGRARPLTRESVPFDVVPLAETQRVAARVAPRLPRR